MNMGKKGMFGAWLSEGFGCQFSSSLLSQEKLELLLLSLSLELEEEEEDEDELL